MKRISLLTLALLLASVSFAQITRLPETLVESPKFNGTTGFYIDKSLDCSPICQYLSKELNGKAIYDEGIVEVLFTVDKDGILKNFSVENAVSAATDKAVVDLLASTSGQWSPGKVDGTPVEMQRKIFVSFYDPENGTIQEQGNEKLQLAIKKYNAALEFKNSLNLSEEKAQKKADNRLKSSLALLKTAEKFLPSEPSVVFWQACAYEQTGNEMMKTQKLNEFSLLIDPNYQAKIEVVGVSL